MSPQLEQNGYIYAPAFLTSQEVNELVQAFITAEAEGKLSFDTQCPYSPAICDLIPWVNMLVKKAPQVSELCGEDVLPTYTYGRIYGNGDVLARHRDRDACEISLTITLRRDETDWPIWFQKPNGEEVGVDLKIGDAVLYLGCAADHWREAYQGSAQTQVFFHYVCAYGPRAYAYFDKERRYSIKCSSDETQPS